ncbi:MAG TPA: phosphohistidine phosphatase SixA [Anaerolineales bacterium]|nr:phosphohistidine phosphatase SixA [Anaerolineales bacterium]
MNLYVVRHAIAEQRQMSATEQEDSQRPLTDEGRKKMRKIAKGLKEMGVQIDLVLTSPYVRAADTAGILVKKLGLDQKVLIVTDNLIPGADAHQLVKEINDRRGAAQNVAIVGHEPGLSRFISVLLSGDPALPIVLKKGGVCMLSMDRLDYARCATLEWLLAPSQLQEISAA